MKLRMLGISAAGVSAVGILFITLSGGDSTAPVAVEPAAGVAGIQTTVPDPGQISLPTAATPAGEVDPDPVVPPKPKPKPSMDEATVAYCNLVTKHHARGMAELDAWTRALRLRQLAEADSIEARLDRDQLAAANRISKLDTTGVSKNVRSDVALLVKAIRADIARQNSTAYVPTNPGGATTTDIAGVFEDDCDVHRKALAERGPALDF